MAVVYFTSNASTGAGSLVEAIKNASPGDVIRPDETVFERGSTIEIVLAATLTLDKNLTLDGGPFRVRLNADGRTRCVALAENANVEMTAFEVVGGGWNSQTNADVGNAAGAGLYVSGGSKIALNRCGFFACRGTYGGAIAVGIGAAATLNDCVVAGCYARGSGAGLRSLGNVNVYGSTIIGNVEASPGTSADILVDGSGAGRVTLVNSIVGKYRGNVEIGDGCVVGVASSQIGFVASPPVDLSAETWNANAWENWDLRLLDDASPNPSPYRDSGDIDAASTYDFDGNFRGRETDGVATRSPGAYETIQADLFWVGIPFFAPGDLKITGYDASTRRATLSWTANLANATGYNIQQSTNGGAWSSLSDSSGAATSRLMGGLIDGASYALRIRAFNETTTSPWSIIRFTAGSDDATTEYETAAPSWGNADGWAASRFAAVSGDVAPQAGQTFFADGAVDFDDAAPQNATLNVGGRGVVSVGGGSPIGLSLGLGATFFLSASATLRRFAPFAKLNWISGDLTVDGDVSTATLDVPPGSTLNVDGGFVCVGELVVADGASVAFSSERGDAVLTATESATVGAATFSGVGYFATPPETDLTAATFAETVRVVDYSAGVADFTATATGPTTARLEWSTTDATARVCVERENAAAPNGWEVVAITPTEGASPLEVALTGKERFRIFDGATFRVDSAWFPTGDFYVYVADSSVSALAAERSEWAAITQTIKAGGAMGYRNENVMFMAQVKNRLSGGWLAPSDVVGITATVCRVYANGFAPDEWVPVDGWEGVAVPTACVLEAPTANDAWTADAEGPNFVWVPDVRERAFFPTGGKFATQLRFDLTDGRNPIYLTFVDEVD